MRESCAGFFLAGARRRSLFKPAYWRGTSPLQAFSLVLLEAFRLSLHWKFSGALSQPFISQTFPFRKGV